MLRARVLTAIVLLAVLLPALFLFRPVVWGGITLLFLSVAAYEWARLQGAAGRAPVAALGLAAAGLGYAGWRASAAGGADAPPVPPALLPLALAAAAFWVIEAPRRLGRGRAAAGGLWVGLPLLFAAWLAVYELRIAGLVLLLSTMVLVWVADVAAYFSGRAFGRHKLAPGISPGKTWEGVAGAMIAVAVLSIWAARASPWAGSLQQLLLERIGLAGMLAAVLLLTGLAIVGDLFESRLKREAGVKDSGRILPGHGGVLDRIDALLPVLPIGLALVLVLT